MKLSSEQMQVLIRMLVQRLPNKTGKSPQMPLPFKPQEIKKRK